MLYRKVTSILTFNFLNFSKYWILLKKKDKKLRKMNQFTILPPIKIKVTTTVSVEHSEEKKQFWEKNCFQLGKELYQLNERKDRKKGTKKGNERRETLI